MTEFDELAKQAVSLHVKLIKLEKAHIKTIQCALTKNIRIVTVTMLKKLLQALCDKGDLRCINRNLIEIHGQLSTRGVNHLDTVQPV